MDAYFKKFYVEILFIDHQTCQKYMSQYMLAVFIVTRYRGRHFWMSSFKLVIDGDHSVSCDVQQYCKYGYITRHGLCCLHAKYHHTQLGYTVVMCIWNAGAQQRQSYLTWAKSCYIMPVSNKLSYLHVSIVLLSQDRVTITQNFYVLDCDQTVNSR